MAVDSEWDLYSKVSVLAVTAKKSGGHRWFIECREFPMEKVVEVADTTQSEALPTAHAPEFTALSK